MKRITETLLIAILLSLLSCSMQNKLNRIYVGEKESFVISKMGQPTRVETLKNGGKIDVYEKRTTLKEVPINTGKFQYDSFNSPKTSKIETFKFKINHSGLVEDANYDCSYER